MAKTYVDLKVETETARRFKQAKHLMEFQNAEEYTVSRFVEILVDNIGKNLVSDINKIEKK